MSSARTIDLSAENLALVCAILRDHVPHAEVRAFGSRTTGKARRYSDLDLVVIADGPLPWRVDGALREAFSESDLPFKVDVLDWATTSPEFRAIIQAHWLPVQDAQPTTAE
jgi:predicted nucleotidyltransferase